MSDPVPLEKLLFLDALDPDAWELLDKRTRACEDSCGELEMAERLAAPYPAPLYWTVGQTLEKARRLIEAFQAQQMRDALDHPDQECEISACPHCNDYDLPSVESHLLNELRMRRATSNPGIDTT